MKFNIMCVHSKYPGRTPQLFAKIELPSIIHVGYKEWIETDNEPIKEEILKALNDSEVRDCIFTILRAGKPTERRRLPPSVFSRGMKASLSGTKKPSKYYAMYLNQNENILLHIHIIMLYYRYR